MRILTNNYLIITVLFIFSIINICVAEDEGLHFGRIKVTPQFDFESRYDNNIFLSSDNEIEDLIFFITPGFSLKYLGNDGNIALFGYKLDLVSYTQRNNNNYQTHTPYIKFNINTPMGLYFNFSEKYKNTADPYGSENTYGDGKKTSRYNNDLNMTFGYKCNIGGVELKYKNKALRYDNYYDQWQDETDNEINLKSYVRITRKVSGMLSYKYIMTDYDRQNDNIIMGEGPKRWSSNESQDASLNNVYVGFRFEPGGKIDGEATIGYGTKSFDNEVDPFERVYEDISTWIVETKLKYQPTEKSDIGFTFLRDIGGSPDSDAASYVNTSIIFDFKQKIVEKISTIGSLAWRNADYRDEYMEANGDEPRPNKYLNTYGFLCGIEYDIQRFLKAKFEYRYFKRNASHTKYISSEYEKNELIFKVSGKL